MKHAKIIPVLIPLLLLTVLFVTVTASATDYTINRMTMNANIVTVRVTASTDCELFVALYETGGKMLAVDFADIKVTPDKQTIPFSFPDEIPVDSYAKAFLLNSETLAPLCVNGDTRTSEKPNPSDDNVYAVLYDDGTLVFQNNDTPRRNKIIREIYTVDPEGYTLNSDLDGEYINFYPTTPWHSQCENIKTVIFLDTIQPYSTAYWFYGCYSLENLQHMERLDTTNVTDMSYMFYGCGELMTLDLSNFNTTNVTDMSSMFAGCSGLTELNLSSLNTTNVTDMSQMFDGCSGLTELNLSPLNTTNVTDMSQMFDGCSGLTELNLSPLDTSNVTSMFGMFCGCSGLTELDLSPLKTENVTNMLQMFMRCSGLTELDLSPLNTENVGSMYMMFADCSGLITLYASDQFIMEMTDGHMMFYNCKNLVGGNGTVYGPPPWGATYAHIDGGPSNPGYFTAKS